jgi:hypothetical protein
MGDERATSSGWLPPSAPGAGPRPRFDAPPPAPPPARPPDRPASAPPEPGAGNPQAVWALVLALVGLLLLLASFGTLFIVTLPCSAAGWVLARKARARLDRSETRWGEGQTAAALWLARIGVIAGVAAAVVFVALLAGGFDFEGFRDDLERELDEQRDRPSGGVRATIDGLRAAFGR